MYEKRLHSIAPMLFTADGQVNGRIEVASTIGLRVKTVVLLNATGLPPLQLEIKQIDSSTEMYVGPVGGNIRGRTNISAYTTALGATISANEQPRPSIPEQEVERNTFEEEPVVARRVFLVDDWGNAYNEDNPFPTVTTVVIPPISIDIDAKDGANISISGHLSPIFDEAEDTIATADFEEIYSYTSSDDLCRITAVDVAVSTPSIIQIKIDGSIINIKRSSSLQKNITFNFHEHRILLSGEVLTIEAKVERKIHSLYGAFTALSAYLA